MKTECFQVEHHTVNARHGLRIVGTYSSLDEIRKAFSSFEWREVNGVMIARVFGDIYITRRIADDPRTTRVPS